MNINSTPKNVQWLLDQPGLDRAKRAIALLLNEGKITLDTLVIGSDTLIKIGEYEIRPDYDD